MKKNLIFKCTASFIVLAAVFVMIGMQIAEADSLTQDDYEFASSTAPTGLILTWQNDPSETMSMTWRTEEEADSMIYYTPVSEDDEDYEHQQARTWTFEETDYWVHGGELRNLKPDTEYKAYVRSGEEEGEKFKFKTAPADSQDITFLTGGDSRSNVMERREVNRRAAELKPDFVLFTGDLQETPPSRDSNWIRWFKDWEELMITEDNRKIPIVPVLGNHEVVGGYHGGRADAQYYYNSFLLPGNEKYYTLQYGPDLTIISLDTGHTSEVDGPQLDWLENYALPGIETDWAVAQQHMQAFTSGSDDDIRFQTRDYWVPLYEEYDVDLVNEAKSHTLKISERIKGIYQAREDIDSWIVSGLDSAEEDFDPEEDYSPWGMPEYGQLSGGDWDDVEDVDSYPEALEKLAYFIGLDLMQTEDEVEEQMIFDELVDTALYDDFRAEIPALYDVFDEEEGVLYIGDGGWGAPLGSPRDAEDTWYLKYTRSDYHFHEVNLNVDQNEMKVTPHVWEDEEDWIQLDSHLITK